MTLRNRHTTLVAIFVRLLAIGTVAPADWNRATIGAIHNTRSSELALDPPITVIDKLALEYWPRP